MLNIASATRISAPPHDAPNHTNGWLNWLRLQLDFTFACSVDAVLSSHTTHHTPTWPRRAEAFFKEIKSAVNKDMVKKVGALIPYTWFELRLQCMARGCLTSIILFCKRVDVLLPIYQPRSRAVTTRVFERAVDAHLL